MPSINAGSCGIIVKLLLNLSKPIVEISISSINIFPFKASNILNKHNVIVLFPDPVLPTIPTLFPDSIVKFKSERTIYVSGLYLTE